MTDTEHGFEPKWTPGPWEWSSGPHKNSELRAPSPFNGILLTRAWGGRSGDAELIALAPELAAAVLEWADCPHGTMNEYGDIDTSECGCDDHLDCADLRYQTAQALRDLAERLRMIGADE